MTTSGLAAAQRITYAFFDQHFAWLPKPKIVEWNNLGGGSSDYSTATTITVPKYSDAWNDERLDVLIHECGHVIAFYLGSLPYPVLEQFLAAMGAPASLITHPLINEIFAEHFARAYDDGYDGHNHPELVGLVPFDAPKMRAFADALRPTVPAVAVPPPLSSASPSSDGERGASPDYGAHFFSQWGPDHVGSGDCVPASAKMLLSLYGVAPLPQISDIRTRADIDADGVINLGRDAGITLDAARAALSDYGLVGTAVLARDVGFDDVAAHVREGKPCMVFLLYADIPGRQDQGFRGLHALVVCAIQGDRAIVLDPDNTRDVPARYGLDDVRRAYDDGTTLGGGAFIPDRVLGGNDMAFADDPDAQAFKNDMLNWQKAVDDRLALDAHHKHPETTITIPQTGEPEAA